MTMLQEQAVQMIQDMSDDNVGLLIEVIQRLIPKKTYTSVIYPSQKPAEKMQALKELVATRDEAKKYLLDDFDPDAELEAVRREKYGSISVMRAIKMDNFKDFEDCLQDRCAEEVSANYIITRNTADFAISVVSAIEPDEWLKKFN